MLWAEKSAFASIPVAVFVHSYSRKKIQMK